MTRAATFPMMALSMYQWSAESQLISIYSSRPPPLTQVAWRIIPCIHADLYFKQLNPGRSAYPEGLALFTEATDLNRTMKEILARDRTQLVDTPRREPGQPASSLCFPG